VVMKEELAHLAYAKVLQFLGIAGWSAPPVFLAKTHQNVMLSPNN